MDGGGKTRSNSSLLDLLAIPSPPATLPASHSIPLGSCRCTPIPSHPQRAHRPPRLISLCSPPPSHHPTSNLAALVSSPSSPSANPPASAASRLQDRLDREPDRPRASPAWHISHAKSPATSRRLASPPFTSLQRRRAPFAFWPIVRCVHTRPLPCCPSHDCLHPVAHPFPQFCPVRATGRATALSRLSYLTLHFEPVAAPLRAIISPLAVRTTFNCCFCLSHQPPAPHASTWQ